MMRGSYVGEEWKRYTVVECKRRLIADLMNMAHAEGSVITFLMSKTDLLLGIKSQRQRPQVDVPVCHRRFSLEQHLIQEASVKLRRCVCHASSQFTKWECGTCLVALHDKCFKRFHTTDDYLDETVHQERLTLKHVWSGHFRTLAVLESEEEWSLPQVWLTTEHVLMGFPPRTATDRPTINATEYWNTDEFVFWMRRSSPLCRKSFCKIFVKFLFHAKVIFACSGELFSNMFLFEKFVIRMRWSSSVYCFHFSHCFCKIFVQIL